MQVSIGYDLPYGKIIRDSSVLLKIATDWGPDGCLKFCLMHSRKYLIININYKYNTDKDKPILG